MLRMLANTQQDNARTVTHNANSQRCMLPSSILKRAVSQVLHHLRQTLGMSMGVLPEM